MLECGDTKLVSQARWSQSNQVFCHLVPCGLQWNSAIHVHTSLRKCLLPCTSCSHTMGRDGLHKGRASQGSAGLCMEGCGKRNVMSSIWLSCFLIFTGFSCSSFYLQFLNSLARTNLRASTDQLNLRRICFCYFPILSCPSFPSSIRTWTQFNLDPFPDPK